MIHGGKAEAKVKVKVKVEKLICYELRSVIIKNKI